MARRITGHLCGLVGLGMGHPRSSCGSLGHGHEADAAEAVGGRRTMPRYGRNSDYKTNSAYREAASRGAGRNETQSGFS